MDRKKKLYTDVLNSINFIEEFTAGINSFDEYLSDFKTQSAVERQIGIIGEALTALRNLNISELTHINEIIGMRNRIIHAYDAIDDSIIWLIIKNHIKPLKEEVLEILIND